MKKGRREAKGLGRRTDGEVGLLLSDRMLFVSGPLCRKAEVIKIWKAKVGTGNSISFHPSLRSLQCLIMHHICLKLLQPPSQEKVKGTLFCDIYIYIYKINHHLYDLYIGCYSYN